MLLLSAQYQLSKARKINTAHLDNLLTKHSATMRTAFVTFLKDAYSEREGITKHVVETNDLRKATELVTKHIETFGRIIPQVFIDAATSEAKHLGDAVLVRKARSVAPFDATQERAVKLMRSSQLKFVQDISKSQRNTIRNAMARSFQREQSPRQAAQSFIGSIGLTPAQQDAVDNYRTLLENGSAAALDRELRNRRFDSSVERAVDEDEPLSDSQIDRMVEAYRRNMLNLRAETIARTESLGVMSAARDEAARQVMEQADLAPEDVTRTWSATRDKRTRDSHYSMDGQEVGLDDPFVTPDGEELQYPGDPNASAGERINCRCTIIYNFS